MMSIIVLSSDGYSDCWNPFFSLFKKNFPNIDDFEIILSTNTKEFEYSDLNLKCVTNGLNTPWSERLINCLNIAKHDIVFVLVEDMFLRSKINSELLKEFILLMQGTTEIDHIRLLSTLSRTKQKPSKFQFLDEIERNTKLRFLYLPGLWKKDVLLKYAIKGENPYISEKLGDYRSYIYRHGFYAVSKKYVDTYGQFYDCEESGALFKGKWPHWVVEFFRNNDIHINLELRGLTTREFRKRSRIQAKLALLKTPTDTIISFLGIFVLYIKSKIFPNSIK